MLSSSKAAHTFNQASAAVAVATTILLILVDFCIATEVESSLEAGAIPDSAAVKISDVRWKGPALLDAGDLARDSYLSQDAELTDSLLGLELGRIDSLYFSLGFLGVRASVDTTVIGRAVRITVQISEGERTRIGEITVSGSDVVPAEELPSRLGISKGDFFDPAALEASMSGLLEELNGTGYPFAQVWMTGFEYIQSANTVDLTFAAYGGERAVVEGVVFDGLAKTDTSLALRTSRLEVGAEFEEEKLARAPRYLSASGLFKNVGSPEVRRLGPGRIDVKIPVEEIERGNSIQGIFGFAKKEKDGYITNGSVDLALRNIGGSGRDVDFRWLDDGVSLKTIRFRYSEAFFFSLPMGLEARLRQDVYDTLYDYTMAGFDLRFSAGPGGEIRSGYVWDNNVPQNDPLLDRSVRHRFSGGLRFIRPGVAGAECTVEGALRKEYSEGSSEQDSQFLYSFKGYVEIPILSRQSLFINLVSEGVLSGGEVKPAEMYPLGGARSLRGYRENQFRGERIGWINLEYRFGGESRIFLFYDAGYWFREETQWELLDGLGFGLLSSSKLGTVALSFGMGERIALEGMLIHLSLTENF
jgi:outer membrane protein assembly factor BamA